MFVAGDDGCVKRSVFNLAVCAGMREEHVRVSRALAMRIGLPSYKAGAQDAEKCGAFVSIFTDLLLMGRSSIVVLSGSAAPVTARQTAKKLNLFKGQVLP